jgi:hypothetical protein
MRLDPYGRAWAAVGTATRLSSRSAREARLGRSFFLAPLLIAVLVSGCAGGGSGDDASADGQTGTGGSEGPIAPPPSDGSGSVPPPILPPASGAWAVPGCTSVTGAAPVTFTADGGLHRAPIETPAAANYFTYGVAALSAASTLAAIVGTTTSGTSAEIFFSTDAGCSWQPSGQTIPNVDYHLSAELSAGGGYAYVWGSGSASVHVIEPTGIAKRFSLGFDSWVSGPYGLGIDPSDPTRVRISIYDCMHRASCGHGSVIMETTDEGATWTQIGVPAPYSALAMRFSPTNLDHIVAPSGPPAGHVTFDGGNQWLDGQGVPTDWGPDEAAIGPDGQTVWLLVHSGSYPGED